MFLYEPETWRYHLTPNTWPSSTRCCTSLMHISQRLRRDSDEQRHNRLDAMNPSNELHAVSDAPSTCPQYPVRQSHCDHITAWYRLLLRQRCLFYLQMLRIEWTQLTCCTLSRRDAVRQMGCRAHILDNAAHHGPQYVHLGEMMYIVCEPVDKSLELETNSHIVFHRDRFVTLCRCCCNVANCMTRQCYGC